MTFLRQIQALFERTYAPTGINLEECLVGRRRCVELSALADPSAQEMSWDGRTFLRVVDGRLHLAIYYHPAIISALERHHPLRVMNAENIRALIVFLEELNHAIHAALLFLENRFQEGTESVLCGLELQAKVDTYLALKLIASKLGKRGKLTLRQQSWVRQCLFRLESFSYRSKTLRHRYREANALGLRLVKYLDSLEPQARIRYIQKFRKLDFQAKRARIQILKMPSN